MKIRNLRTIIQSSHQNPHSLHTRTQHDIQLNHGAASLPVSPPSPSPDPPMFRTLSDPPSTFPLQHRIQRYKQVNTKNLRKERRIVSYPPLGLADMTVRPVVVHQRLALSVLLVPHWDGFELLGCPPLTYRVTSLKIFNQPINLPLKLLLLGQVDVMRLMWLYHPLQHL
jgi:hypothetical protein